MLPPITRAMGPINLHEAFRITEQGVIRRDQHVGKFSPDHLASRQAIPRTIIFCQIYARACYGFITMRKYINRKKTLDVPLRSFILAFLVIYVDCLSQNIKNDNNFSCGKYKILCVKNSVFNFI